MTQLRNRRVHPPITGNRLLPGLPWSVAFAALTAACAPATEFVEVPGTANPPTPSVPPAASTTQSTPPASSVPTSAPAASTATSKPGQAGGQQGTPNPTPTQVTGAMTATVTPVPSTVKPPASAAGTTAATPSTVVPAMSSGVPGGKAPANPSTGCGKATPMLGSSGSPLTVSSHKYYVKVPASYDGTKPLPVIFMFHPTGNPIDWAEKNAGYEKNAAKDTAIRVYPASASNSSGWVASDVSFFQPLYDSITQNFCVDKARVFASGESSGGDFSSILGCEHADKLRVTVPCSTKDVSAYPLDATKRKCTGQVAAVVIQGKNDNVVGPENGPKTRDFYSKVNHCNSMTPTAVMGYTDALSNCVLLQGCDAGYPVYWCQHTDPEYSGTNHGWPKFAGNMTWEVFSQY